MRRWMAMYDIDTIEMKTENVLLHTCDVFVVCEPLCEFNHVVYIILYLLVVCNRDGIQNWIANV